MGPRMVGAARSNRPLILLAPLAVLVLAGLLAAFPSAAAQESPPSSAASPAAAPEGARLFAESCASCHGAGGAGGEFGPSLENAGAAAADFQLRTGRMPLADPGAQTVRKPPAFSPEEIEALVLFVASLGEGPEVPSVSIAGADISRGQELFVDNCAACHGAIASGGAAGPGALAPSLYRAEPLDIAEAMLTGPGEMPRFNLDTDEINSIAAFVVHLQEQDPPGGADIGGIGPVPEGFVAWALGIPALVGACWLLGRSRKERA